MGWKTESFEVYISKIKAYAEFMGIGDTLDPILMANCPTRMEFAEIDVPKSVNHSLIDLYRAITNSSVQSLLRVRARVIAWLC